MVANESTSERGGGVCWEWNDSRRVFIYTAQEPTLGLCRDSAVWDTRREEGKEGTKRGVSSVGCRVSGPGYSTAYRSSNESAKTRSLDAR